MKLRTTTDWRPYPEQKPPKVPRNQRFSVFRVLRATEAEDSVGGTCIWYKNNTWDDERVTHFALYEDISTVEVEG